MPELTAIELDRLENPRVAQDGGSVSFDLRASGGDGARVVCRADDLERVIAYLAGLGGQAAARRPDVTPTAFGDTDRVLAEPIETSDVGLVRGLEAGEAQGGELKQVKSAAVLVVHEQSFPLVDLRVEFDRNPLAELRFLWEVYRPKVDFYVQRAVDPDSIPYPET